MRQGRPADAATDVACNSTLAQASTIISLRLLAVDFSLPVTRPRLYHAFTVALGPFRRHLPGSSVLYVFSRRETHRIHTM